MHQIGKYIMGEHLGQGGSGVVAHCWDIQTDNQYAIKQIPLECSQEAILVSRLKGMKIENVVQFFEVLQHEGFIYIVMEYCNGQNLHNQIHVQKKQFTHLAASKIALQVKYKLKIQYSQIEGRKRDSRPSQTQYYAQGHQAQQYCDQYFRKQSIQHPQQNQYKENGEDQYKICDFGISKTEAQTATKKLGTQYYLAPEQFSGEQMYDSNVDIFALGLVIFEIFRGVTYYDNLEQFYQLQYKKLEYDSVTKVKTQGLQKDVCELLAGIIKRNPTERFPITTVIQRLESMIKNPTPVKKEIKILPNQPVPPQKADNPDTQPPPLHQPGYNSQDQNLKRHDSQYSNQLNKDQQLKNMETQKLENVNKQYQWQEEQLIETKIQIGITSNQIKQQESKLEQLSKNLKELSETLKGQQQIQQDNEEEINKRSNLNEMMKQEIIKLKEKTQEQQNQLLSKNKETEHLNQLKQYLEKNLEELQEKCKQKTEETHLIEKLNNLKSQVQKADQLQKEELKSIKQDLNKELEELGKCIQNHDSRTFGTISELYSELNQKLSLVDFKKVMETTEDKLQQFSKEVKVLQNEESNEIKSLLTCTLGHLDEVKGSLQKKKEETDLLTLQFKQVSESAKNISQTNLESLCTLQKDFQSFINSLNNQEMLQIIKNVQAQLSQSLTFPLTGKHHAEILEIIKDSFQLMFVQLVEKISLQILQGKKEVQGEDNQQEPKIEENNLKDEDKESIKVINQDQEQKIGQNQISLEELNQKEVFNLNALFESQQIGGIFLQHKDQQLYSGTIEYIE